MAHLPAPSPDRRDQRQTQAASNLSTTSPVAQRSVERHCLAQELCRLTLRRAEEQDQRARLTERCMDCQHGGGRGLPRLPAVVQQNARMRGPKHLRLPRGRDHLDRAGEGHRVKSSEEICGECRGLTA